MPQLPTGTVTFFFSDIEGSTRLLEALGPRYDNLLEQHHGIVRDALAASGAVEVGTQGDSFFAVSRSAADAVQAAVAIQRAIATEAWPDGVDLRVRIGLHTGEARMAADDYVGLDVHRAARILASAHGGQIVVSATTRGLLGTTPADGITLRDLGEHRLRDLSAPERLYQVVGGGLRTDFPPLRTLDAIPNNLPTQASELVGREAELAQIHGHLESGGVRLLTLTGPGGIGKTRLSLQAAAEEIDRFGDGVYFVDLSPARDSDAALEAMVRALGVTLGATGGLRVALAQELRTRHVLLVLDNFEQVMPAAEDVAELLKLCPHLKALVTSREALRVRGEQLLPVEPLGLPRGRDRQTAEDVSGFAAVRLFVERAREARPTFALTDENAAAIAEICARLDGLPLAIELAAARLRLFSPEELRDRLRSRLEVLRGGARDLPTRQRTLRSTIEWSYELLDDDERALFALLSVFPSARVDAVEAVAAAVEATAVIDVVDRLASLVDKSLVRTVSADGGDRLSMLDTIREYATEQLAADPAFADAVRHAHATEYATFAGTKGAALRGRDRPRALDEIAGEIDNVRAAWRHFVDERDIGGLTQLLDAMWAIHDARGWYHGAVELTNDLLAVTHARGAEPADVDDEITLRLSLVRGILAVRGYTEEVERLYHEALALAERAGALPQRLPVLRSLASFHLYRGEIDKTVEVGRQMLAIAEREGDIEMEVEGLVIVGPATGFLGDGSTGVAQLDRAIELFDPERHGRARFRLGPNPGVAARAVSALLQFLYGFPEDAARRAASALEAAEQLGHPYSLAYGTFHVALLDLWGGHFSSARSRANAVLAVAGEHDYRIWRAVGMVVGGVATGALGDAEEGLAQTKGGISLYENLQTPPVFWPQLLGLHALALTLARRTDEANDVIEQARAIADEGSWDSIALKIQHADLLAALGQHDDAVALLRRADLEAGPSGTRTLVLRARAGLARLTEQPSDVEALREIYATFTEGFDWPDLVAARAVLEASTSPQHVAGSER